MKQYILTCIFLLTVQLIHAQSPTPAEQVATTIAQKMKDSLQLSKEQQQQLYTINMQLHHKQLQARQQQQSQGVQAITKSLQQIENTRDSLYRAVLNQEQFGVYQKKKRNLISIN